jgi:hypothetical protein
MGEAEIRPCAGRIEAPDHNAALGRFGAGAEAARKTGSSHFCKPDLSAGPLRS